MKYIIGFQMEGTLEIEADDEEEAIEYAEALSDKAYFRAVKQRGLLYIEDEANKNRTLL